MADDNAGNSDIERYMLRFAELADRQSPWQPIDTLIERFDRERYSVVGRPAEGTGQGKSVDEVDAFNMTYLRCDPGKGIGTHAHATPEVFIPMAGRWSITLGENAEQEVIAEPWDVISVPPDAMHGAINISDQVGWLMTINAGHGGARIRWAAPLLDELRALGHDVEESEQPGETR